MARRVVRSLESRLKSKQEEIALLEAKVGVKKAVEQAKKMAEKAKKALRRG